MCEIVIPNFFKKNHLIRDLFNCIRYNHIYPEFGIVFASSALVRMRALCLLVGTPPIPQKLTARRSGYAPTSCALNAFESAAIKKAGEQHLYKCHPPVVSSFLLFLIFVFSLSLLFVDFQELIYVLFCNLIVHHLLLCCAILLIDFFLYR